MNDMELQPNKPKRQDGSSKSENDGSVRPPGADKPAAGGSAEPANKPVVQNKNKYGSVPPPCLKSDAEVSQWLLEAEQEDRRQAGCDAERSDQRRGRAKRSGGRLAEEGLPESIIRYLENRRWRHRGCSYRMPVSDPIPMPIIPYDPCNQLWLRQEFRRIQGNKPPVKKVSKKKKRSMQALAEDGFAVAKGCQSDDDDDDYNSEDDLEYNEKGEVLCPICSRMPVEVGVDVTPRGQDTAGTIVTTADDTTITVVDCPPADAVRDAAFIIAARAAIRKTSVDLLQELKGIFGL